MAVARRTDSFFWNSCNQKYLTYAWIVATNLENQFLTDIYEVYSCFANFSKWNFVIWPTSRDNFFSKISTQMDRCRVHIIDLYKDCATTSRYGVTALFWIYCTGWQIRNQIYDTKCFLVLGRDLYQSKGNRELIKGMCF